MTLLCKEELKRFEDDLKNNSIFGVQYLDTWEYEDEYSHKKLSYQENNLLMKQMKF